MSEQRIPDRVIKVNLPRIEGKIQHGFCPDTVFELYGAYQFKLNHRRFDRNFKPTVPIRSKEKEHWYKTMYRVRINGKWYPNVKEIKYLFFNKKQISELLIQYPE